MTEIFHQHQQENSFLGFWLYLMTDLIMFAALFASYIVLKNNNFNSPGGEELFNLSLVLFSTIVLLTSSFTCGLAGLYVEKRNVRATSFWLLLTLILGSFFLFLGYKELNNLVLEGYSWQTNAFLSAFFSLIILHGLHIAAGILWITVSFFQLRSFGLSDFVASKLRRLFLFWHFLDVVWIFIFTIVYLYAHI
ncbi:MAG: cytochrome c oxidase subunit 3 [Candidatus Doudnabacteria bacterium]|nr:cytochrome c oxidase subunit 3 [Candidatus Doudnabacteria bacterium]